MVNSNANALGILFPNSYDSLVPDLVSERLMASIPFASRYRLVDFILSSMANCGIDNISLIVRRNYHSLMDHLGSGREWDLTRKNGGLNLVPPFAEKTVSIYNGRVEALASILDFLKEQKEKYVVMADTNLAVNFDFNALIQAHMDSQADVTVAYREEPLPGDLTGHRDIGKSLYYTLAIGNGRVTKMYMNSKEPGVQNFSMNIYIIDREFLIDQINTAYVRGQVFFERDILAPQIGRLNVQAFRYDGYVARISSMKSYFDENMKMLDDANVNALFSAGNPIYTKIRDDNPARYINGSKAANIMAADGCIIEGEVENSILFRGVKIGMGARVKNCVLMQDTVIEAGASVEYAVTDKNVTITKGKDIKGTDTFPVYVAKYQIV
ncbi:glucose-1-phosphate adenylyltransferase subunit GlgD [Enterocloster clostridioformis]|uniref:glucose-1-phosphate adenylyltransferase subunit GlgD n=1 Tax=Enterocloster clostridioformis TaxID=1531 RepID=UPI00080C9C78|nr:glucose-1-phosphate adenylyltransferase subunit GlgD [Enterocloster clostridioformis]ANU45412.1 glucose-1-phosphate adenylyltransferase subunit GlgD [Lachnoclostridium sp. YL32]NDO32270.1 glucose-1-phosphate adenylyltransferase subunit GlgD [Enterocloster clostridioformis]OXE63307.1 glucose-1-phosphate adenylyltransferase subunit GlgD [Enterocloster clostridioformis]QQQ99819.1 glucose-1-phosphate adenylyltransferase subunit GlgD [Enterocloster clostridioformis]